MKKSHYLSEIKKMKQNHKKYFPVVLELMNLYKSKTSENIEFVEKDKICTLVELIDIGYLDGKVVVIKKYFDDIEKIIYTGHYPLTLSGEKFLEYELSNNYKKQLLIRIFLGLFLFLGFITILFLFF